MITGAFLGYGILSRISLVGDSVVIARAANVSLIKLTHRSYTAFSSDSLSNTDPMNTINMATKLTVSWNCKNFLTLSKTFRPYIRATTIELKLSSNKMMSEAPLATSVP